MSNCRGCGKPMLWGVDQETGAKIPLDPRAPVYELCALEESTNTFTVRRSKTHHVSHFATCPKANQFSGKGNRAEG